MDAHVPERVCVCGECHVNATRFLQPELPQGALPGIPGGPSLRDSALAQPLVLQNKRDLSMRIGFGYDSHRFGSEKPCILGGVTFPGVQGFKAHSDGDVLTHAIIDAILGAADLGDIGSHFPDTDEKWRGADSIELLKAVVDEVKGKGFKLGNVDATIICEKPKIRPKVDEIKAKLGGVLGCQVSVKGKTNEKMDDIGAGLGVEVHAVALLEG